MPNEKKERWDTAIPLDAEEFTGANALHRELAQQVFEQLGGDETPWAEAKWSTFNVQANGSCGSYMVIVSEFVEFGPGEADSFAVVGFYVPHDGQCTVVVNGMDGMATLDNADQMFPGA